MIDWARGTGCYNPGERGYCSSHYDQWRPAALDGSATPRVEIPAGGCPTNAETARSGEHSASNGALA
ncbi:MAG: hypothetical protein ACRDTZ_10055 [Pseudonocardiaceae bacterium]